MPNPKLVTLETWANDTYGDDAPCMNRLRRWAREARIYPAPVKHGRSYFLQPNAQYLPFTDRSSRLVDRIRSGARGDAVQHERNPKS